MSVAYARAYRLLILRAITIPAFILLSVVSLELEIQRREESKDR